MRFSKGSPMQTAVKFVIEFCDTGGQRGRIRSDDVNPRASTRVSGSGGAVRRGRSRRRRCRAASRRASIERGGYVRERA